jgi:hypothetical protein
MKNKLKIHWFPGNWKLFPRSPATKTLCPIMMMIIINELALIQIPANQNVKHGTYIIFQSSNMYQQPEQMAERKRDMRSG